jgi:hypothetical protein
VASFEAFAMNALGISLIVGGVVFLVSGLIFLLSGERKFSARERSLKESQEEIEHYLRKMRNERGEL